MAISVDLLLTFLRKDLASVGRLWLLFRTIDTGGRGWLWVETIRDTFCQRDSKVRICGWRRLRQLLKAGSGIFWQRDDAGRLWLTGQPKLAIQIDSQHTTGKHVHLPTKSVLASLSDAKAAFYAALHSARGGEKERSRPISRDCLEQQTGLSPRTQLRYDNRLNIEKRQATAVGRPYASEHIVELAWKGKKGFRFTDRQGRLGAANVEYVAWHLPNQYGTKHQIANRTIQKRFQRKVNRLLQRSSTLPQKIVPNQKTQDDLAITRAQGNSLSWTRQCYFESGAQLRGSSGETYLQVGMQPYLWIHASR